MSDRKVNPTDEFYKAVADYQRQHSYDTWSQALLHLAAIGYEQETEQPAPVAYAGRGGWRGKETSRQALDETREKRVMLKNVELAKRATEHIETIIRQVEIDYPHSMMMDDHLTSIFFVFPEQTKKLLKIMDTYHDRAHDLLYPGAIPELRSLLPEFTAENVVR